MSVQKPLGASAPAASVFPGAGEVVKRTYVYVDGFNLYYRALRKTKFKWLDLEALVRGLLDADNSVDRSRYFTAPVSGKFDPGVPVRQQR